MTRHDYETAIDAHLPDVIAKLIFRLQNFPQASMKRMMLERFDEGNKKHPPLDLATDKRDWLAEESEELVDAAAYRVFAISKRLMGL
jgi:hypothetical protein